MELMPGFRRLREAFRPIGRWLGDVDFGEHEEKILLMLAMVISATVGLIIVAFVVVTEYLGARLANAGAVERFVTPVAGSLVGGWLLYRFFPDARGSGIPQTRVALLLHDGVISLRTVAGKFLCSSLALGSGVALGREGPSVHIGAGVASVAARRLGLSGDGVRSLIPVGTAAAVAAAFNTPLAAVLFTLEEILADLHARVVGTVVIGAATSWIVLRLILGDEPLFHVPAYELIHPVEFLIYGLLGLAGGVVSHFFVKALLWQRAFFLKVPLGWKAITPAAGGLVVGVLALLEPGVLGVGYQLVSDALNGRMALQAMALLLLLKIVATSACYGSGNAGGIFGPSLFIGAMLGGAIGQGVHTLLPDHTGNAGAYALVGMGAAFAGIIRTPMTSVIMIFEVTRDYTIIVPLMIANLCSYFLAGRLQRTPVYEALSRQEGVTMPSASHRPAPLTVDRAMRHLAAPVGQAGVAATQPAVYPDDPLDMALQVLGRKPGGELAVISRAGGRLLGKVGTEDILRAYERLAADGEQAGSRPRRSHTRLPAVGALMAATVLIVSGLVFWQRARRAERSVEAHDHGVQLLTQGRVEEAVLAFRNGLANTPQDARLRAALGLALIRTGHLTEASFYLREAAKSDAANGSIWGGLAEIALARGDQRGALDLFRQALAKDWPEQEEPLRREAQFTYASLLAETGRQNEAMSQLLLVIAQKGDDPATGKRAAEAIQAFGSPEQVEETYQLLARQFPADSGVWMRLGDTRLGGRKDSLALEAYRRALKVSPDSEEARQAVERVETILRLDPTRRGLPVRERARRWDELLQRVLKMVEACGRDEQAKHARPLIQKKASTLRLVDEKMAAVRKLWLEADPSCRTDAVVSSIMAKLEE